MTTATAMIPLGTKAESLARLSSAVTRARVLPLFSVELRRWRTDRDGVLDEVLGRPWADQPLIVRSSAAAEDGASQSFAGHFRTLAGVHGRAALAGAVDDVFASYDRPGPDDHLLIQPELRNSRLSGVACSCHPSTGAPYYVVNWVESPETDAVTSGRGRLHTWYGARYAESARAPSAPIAAVLALLSELRVLTATSGLDVEFAVSEDDELILLQVRPLVVGGPRLSDGRHGVALTRIADRVAAGGEPTTGVPGRRTVYGVMPDWNPAEMIGLHPRPLALSLYRALITDRTWARARRDYGYRDLRGTPLLVSLAGLPYIDVRASAASLVPAAAPDEVAERLVDHAVDTLAAQPHLHDKLESRIVVSAHSFRAADRLPLAGAERTAFLDVLRRMTDDVITGDRWQRDLAKLRALDDRPADAPTSGHELALRLERCVEHGTLPFAGLARAAFIATELLDDLVTEDVLSAADKAAFVAGLNLVSAELRRDFAELAPDAFLKRYGHLRPGTYDILSPRYDEAPDVYFDFAARRVEVEPAPEFHPRDRQRRRIDELLRQAGFSFPAERLLEFAGAAIRGREQAKFDFTRVLSDLLVQIRTLGERFGFTADDMSYVDVDTLRALTGERGHDTALLAEAVERGVAEHAVGQLITLPPLITGPADVWSFRSPHTRPNFVTDGHVAARVADVDAGDRPDGAIALVASADPGYDWLFARGIVGLVTAFGGVNSHMALRALELGVPAVIGAGMDQFREWSRAAALDIDAACERVAVLS
jgi:phosphohistidine swiveling domain-containing protein